MEIAQTVVNAAVIAVVGVVLARMTHGLRHDVMTDIGEFRAELKREISELRTELKEDITELRAEIRELRSDLTRVALVVGAERRADHQ